MKKNSVKSMIICLLAMVSLGACDNHNMLVGEPYLSNSIELQFVDSEGNNLLTTKDGCRTVIFDDFEVYRSCSPDFKEERMDIRIIAVRSEDGEMLLLGKPHTCEIGNVFDSYPIYAPTADFVPIYPGIKYGISDTFNLGLTFGFAKDDATVKSQRVVRMRLVWPEGNRQWNFELTYEKGYKNPKFFMDGDRLDVKYDSGNKHERLFKINLD
ncbi:MAG: hypothetical protein K2M19_09150 [Muribaculaceae bacterium]|nr:hypothetical protein [Muribaculaceae bacterium]